MNGLAGADRSILVVDDEPLIRFNLVDFFADEDFTVFEADSAEDAIRVVEANPAIRVVLTDVQMPGSMDGVMLAHVVRGLSPAALMVITSGAAHIGPEQLPLNAIFIPKPLDPNFALGEIERLAVMK